jgi:hypothetical protein
MRYKLGIMVSVISVFEGFGFVAFRTAFDYVTFAWTLCSLPCFVKFGSIDSHSPMRGHMGHPEASQGDLENQPVL